MVKKMLTGLIVGSLLAVLVTACGVKDASTVAIPTVHMGATGFIQNSSQSGGRPIGPDRSEHGPLSRDGLAQIKKGSEHLFHTTETHLGTNRIHKKDINE